MEYGNSSAWMKGKSSGTGNTFPASLMGKAAPQAINWRAATTDISGVLSVYVSAIAYPAVFSELVGVMTLNGFDILEAKSLRNNDQTTVMLKVRSVSNDADAAIRLRRAKAELNEVAGGRMNLSLAFRKQTAGCQNRFLGNRFLKPPEISVDDQTSFLFTLIHVSGTDFPGVLFMMTDAIVKCGLTIWNTKIKTVQGRIEDVFYVKDQNGKKLNSPQQIAMLQAKLRNAYKLLRYF